MIDFLIVALGGAIGAMLRYAITNLAAEKINPAFPYGTLIANLIGCFFIGLCMTLLTEKTSLSPYWRLLITVGILGGLTTFSSFSYETIKLLQAGQTIPALLNIGANVALGLIATICGIAVMKSTL